MKQRVKEGTAERENERKNKELNDLKSKASIYTGFILVRLRLTTWDDPLDQSMPSEI